MMQFIFKIPAAIDAVTEWIGRICGVLVLLLVFVTLAVVVLRYGFDVGYVWMQELYVWFYGCIFLAGAGYTLKHDQHVRVDIFYANASDRYRAWVNLLGAVFLLWPMIFIIFYYSIGYVHDSWSRQETSFQSGGMPFVYLYKTMLLFFSLNIFLQSISLALRNICQIKRGKNVC